MILFEVASVGSRSKESQPLARVETKSETESHDKEGDGVLGSGASTDRSSFRYKAKRSMHQDNISIFTSAMTLVVCVVCEALQGQWLLQRGHCTKAWVF